jgi:hypothetical protein
MRAAGEPSRLPDQASVRAHCALLAHLALMQGLIPELAWLLALTWSGIVAKIIT